MPANLPNRKATGLINATAMAFAPDGRLFVCQQDGRLRVIKNGALLATPFVTLPVDSAGERGLLGIAFDPNFATNQFVYVYYTATTPATHNRVSRFTANGDIALAGSEVLFRRQQSQRRDNTTEGPYILGRRKSTCCRLESPPQLANGRNLLGKFCGSISDGTCL